MTKMLTSCGTWPFVFPPNKPRGFGEVVKRLADLKFDAIEFGAFGPHPSPGVAREAWPKIRQIWERLGLGCSGLAVGFGNAKLITDATPDAYMQAFRANLDFCKAVGAPAMRVDTGDPPNVLGRIEGEPDSPVTVEPTKAIERAATVWKQCAKLAADAGVRITWEPEPGFALNRPSDVLKVCATVDHPNFGIMFDTCHAYCMAVEGARQPGKKETLIGGVVAFAEALAGKINHVHLIDSNGRLHDGHTSEHPPFGEGVLKFNEIMPVLRRVCRPEVGTWTVDLCFWPTAWEALEKCKQFLDGLVAKFGQ
jgi:sugar phosphate isomerase/epimerase